jgi:hypothetical protein
MIYGSEVRYLKYHRSFFFNISQLLLVVEVVYIDLRLDDCLLQIIKICRILDDISSYLEGLIYI